LRFNNESSMTMETRMTRKRKAATDAIDNGKENQPPGGISTVQLPSKRICAADPTQQSSDQIILPLSSQSRSEPVAAPTQPPSCESCTGSIADTVGSAFSQTVIPLSSQSPSAKPVSAPAQPHELRSGGIADCYGSEGP
jgi:hypothetical protein